MLEHWKRIVTYPGEPQSAEKSLVLVMTADPEPGDGGLDGKVADFIASRRPKDLICPLQSLCVPGVRR